MRLHCLQHEAFEGLANIERWALKRQMPISKTLFYAEPMFPHLDEFDGLVIMGGSMGTYDEHRFPWLRTEKEFIRRCLAAQKPTLGVCLGSQLLAECLGGRVFPGHGKEIGWFEVRETAARSEQSAFAALPPKFTPLHWHGDTFELPSGVSSAYSSDLYPNQAFSAGKQAVGVQFHLELTKADLQALMAGSTTPAPGGCVQALDDILSRDDNFSANAALLEQLLSAVFA